MGSPVNAEVEKGVCEQICESRNVLNSQVSSLAGVLGDIVIIILTHHFQCAFNTFKIFPSIQSSSCHSEKEFLGMNSIFTWSRRNWWIRQNFNRNRRM